MQWNSWSIYRGTAPAIIPVKIRQQLFTRDSGDTLDLNHTFCRDSSPFIYSSPGNAQFTRNLGHKPPLRADLIHSVVKHKRTLTSGKRFRQAKYLPTASTAGLIL